MRRRLFNALSLLSLLLFVAVCVLWGSGRTAHVMLDDSSTESRVSRWLACGRGRVGYYKSEVMIYGPTTAPMRVTAFDAPLWTVAASAAVLPAAWLCPRLSRDRAVRGLCPACGYDLRATPDRCPECGTIPAKTLA